MRALCMVACAAVLLSAGACRTAQVGYPLGSEYEADRIETKEQMLQRYGVPATALREGDGWLYTYRARPSNGYAIGFGPGGLLGGVTYDHTTTDVLQFRVSDDGRVRSVTPLYSTLP